jgi:hypothetical protein
VDRDALARTTGGLEPGQREELRALLAVVRDTIAEQERLLTEQE